MRVMVATAHRGVVGGVETYLRAVIPRLRDAVGDLLLLAAHPAPPGPAIDDHCPGLAVRVGEDPATVAADWKPDVVFAHGLPDPAAEAALTATPTVYFAHNYAGLCVSGTKCHAAPGWAACGRRLGPACLGLYLPRRCGGANPVTAVRLYRDNRRRQTLLSRYAAVLAASRHMAADLVRNGAPPERVHLAPLFPPGITPDPDPPAPRPVTGRVLFVGRITALKGWRELLAALPVAAAKLGRRLTVVVAGDGPDRAAFEAEAGRRKVPAEFLGWVGADCREAEMRVADVLAVPSVWPEPFGLVGVEAGCVGLPAVGFAVGGIPDWLEPGVGGELAPGDRPDATELAAGLVRAMADDARRHRLGVGAWEAARRFSPEAHMNALLPVLRAADKK